MMSYSLDLRSRVINFVENGGGISRASKLFQVSRSSIYRWFARTNLHPTSVLRRHRKLNWSDLEKDVQQNPDARLIDRALKFGVRPSAISYALAQLKITRKKNSYVIRKEIDRKESIIIVSCEN